MGIPGLRAQLHRLPAGWSRSTLPGIAGLLVRRSWSPILWFQAAGRWSSSLRRTREQIPWALELNPDLGQVTRWVVYGAGTQSPLGVSTSGIAGLDDFRGCHSFDPCPQVDQVPPVALARHRARTPPPARRVRVDAWQVAGSPYRVGRDRPNVTTSHFANPGVLASLRREYEQKIERDSATLDEFHLDRQQLHVEELQWAQRHLLLVEKDAVIDAFHRRLLSQAVQEKLLANIDGQLLEIESIETKGTI